MFSWKSCSTTHLHLQTNFINPKSMHKNFSHRKEALVNTQQNRKQGKKSNISGAKRKQNVKVNFWNQTGQSCK